MSSVALAPLEAAAATAPPESRGLRRDGVRLLVASAERLLHLRFADLERVLAPGDALVINASRTLAASVPARRADGSHLTLNLSTPAPLADDESRWVVELRRGGARAHDGRAGEILELPGGARARLLAPYLGTRLWVAALDLPRPLADYLARHGHPIRYAHLDGEWPLELLQNVYATEPGSAEMPSAGRPFTPELITALVARGVDVAPLLLHTGVSSLERGEAPYPERLRIPETTAERANLAHRLGRRVIAVGTTVVRALESAADEDGRISAAEGWTDLVIDSDRGVRAVDAILTGFHDADSSHMSLLEAVGGPEPVAQAHRVAAAAGYLRHEFGDVQLIEGPPPAERRIARRWR